MRFHDLRHSFASHYMMRGGSLYDLKEILGHSDINNTARSHTYRRAICAWASTA